MKSRRLPSWVYPSKRHALVGVVVAVGLVAFSTFLRISLAPLLRQLLFFTYFPAVMIAGWFGGFWPGLLATLLSAACVNYFIVGQGFEFASDPLDLIRITVFICCGFLFSALNGILHFLLRNENVAREEYEVTLASIGDAVIVTDATGKITFLNPVACELTGWDFKEAFGQPLPSVFRVVNEETRLPGSNPLVDVLKHGHRVQLESHSVLLSKSGFEIPIEDSAAPVHGSNGELIGAVLVFYDITERRKAQNALRDHAISLEKTVAERTSELRTYIAQLEEFSYAVSHDLRAPLRAMQGYATAVLEDCGQQIDEKGKSYLNHIVKAATRMDQLTRDVLAYSKISREGIELHCVRLEPLVQGILDQYPNVRAANAEVTVRTPLSEVLGNESLLIQAIGNLINNAVKFVPPERAPKIEIWTEDRPKNRVRLFVKDNGIGIKPEYQAKLFGLFERINPRNQFEGTGIGLAIVRKAAERLDGTAGLESDGENGSTFWIELPNAKTEAVRG